jgi:PAS domain S-box-containing protein
MVLLNLFFTWLASLCICFLTARGFLGSGQPCLLMFGCGSLVWGFTSLIAAMLVDDSNVNPTITIHNVGVLGAALCHLAGLLWRGRLPRPGQWLVAGYAGALGAAALIVWAATAGLTPVFFMQGHGGTPFRQVVLLLAIAMFAWVAWQMIYKFWRRSGAFYYWYGLGLALVAIGLTGVMLLSVQGGILGWANRLTQYLGSAYLFIAALMAARETGSWTLSMTAVEEAWRKGELLPGFGQQSPFWWVWRYVQATVAVATAMGIRQALTAWFGPGLPSYITFYPLIMVAALLGGFGPGLLATALACFTVAYWVLPPVGQFAIDTPVDRLGLVIFSGMGLFMGVVAELYRRNRDKAAAYDREAALRESQARLVTFATSTFEGIVESEAGRIVDCNEQFARMFGYSEAELKGMEIAKLITPEDFDRVTTNIRQDQESVIEHGALRKDGTKITVEAHGRPVSPGSAVRHTAIRDITKHKRAEEALRLSEEKFAMAFAGNPAAIALTRLEDGLFLDVNDTWLALNGYSRDEVIGLSARKLSIWPTVEAATSFVQALQEQGSLRGWEQAFFKRSGEVFVAQLSATVLNVRGDKLILSTLVDITDRKQAEEALRESEQRFRLALLNTPVSVAVQDRDLRYIWNYNQKTAPPDGIIGKTDADIFTPEEAAHITAMKRRVLEEGVELREQLWLDRPSGRIYLDVCWEPVRDIAGNVIGVGNATVDLTLMKLAQEAAQESEARLRMQMERMPIGCIVYDAQNCFSQMNPAAEGIFGYLEYELKGRHANVIVPEASRPHVDGILRRLAEGDMTANSDNENVTKDGRTIICQWTNTPLRDQSGAFTGFLSMVQDVTEQRRAEKALREALAKAEEGDRLLAALMEHVPEGITIAHAPDMKLRLVSRYGQELLGAHAGLTVEEVIAQLKVYQLDGVTAMEHADLPLVRALERGEVVTNVELLQVNADGRSIPLLCNAAPLRDQAGAIVAAIVVWRDITERKLAEEALMSSLHEKEVLLKEIHHRVKNNMQVISSLVSLQADGSQDETVREVLRDVTYRVRSMALVHEKLYQSADLAHIDFAEYSRSLLNYLWRSHGAAAANVRLTLDLSPVQLPVDTAVPCGLILNELVGNALKHAFQGRPQGEVTVSLKVKADDQIHLSVGDDGVGLPVGLDWRKANSLGLRLVQMLGGQVGASVEVTSGGGTRFEIVI